MKALKLSLLLLLSAITASANHITGGEMYYTFLGKNGTDYSYHVVLNLYRDCFSNGAPLDDAVAISVFDNGNFATVWANNNIPRSKIVHLNLSSPSPCIQNPPAVCYDVGYYEFDVTVPASLAGYTITFQRCCRIAGINNLNNSSTVGATYTAEIPGTSSLPTAPENSSARFVGEDTVAVCAKNPFTYNFGAVDIDKDSLVYYFGTAYTGGNTGNPAPKPPDQPPYQTVPYAFPYTSASPLGSSITINSHNGLLTGTAPIAGIYVVTVYVDEYRNGVRIATQKKDLQIKVADCSLTTPQLDPQYITCNGYDLTFFNHNSNPLIHTYSWTFGDGNTSTASTPTNTYGDTGVYKVKLVVNKGEQCTDSATTIAKVYPGFYPGFIFNGVCNNHPTLFTDTSHTKYGFIDSWTWNFGDPTGTNNTSNVQNPTHTYTQTGTNTIQFIVTSNKGCTDTIQTPITIIDKPVINLNPADTLICNGDFVQLTASGQGIVTWLGYNSQSNGSASITVNPTSTSVYTVQLNEDGCLNTMTSRVRVVDFVTLKANPDTVICGGDPIQLGATTDGLHFLWTPSSTLNDPTLLNPMAVPQNSTTFQILSRIGHCTATDQMTVRLVPYPGSDAGLDTTICYHTTAQLHGTIKGSSFSWSPGKTLSNPLILDPISKPISGTTQYVLTVFDTLGCPKPGRDTIIVTMLPKINAYAGNDTAVVIGQPLQLQGSGGVGYLWTPPDGLNHNNISNPLGFYDGSFDSIKYTLYVSNESGCIDSSYLTVKVFKTDPRVFVPSAFTPNDDGLNDQFRPIAVGISKIEYFRVFNRWGELVFSTTVNGKGWDGKIAGKPQGSGTFVWVVRGLDYLGKQFFAKGTVTLIR
jgi:FOG: PKD repeat